MAKLTEKNSGAVLDLNDLFHAVDISDTTDGASGTSKKYTISQIAALVGNAFSSLADTPNTYSGKSEYLLRVNTAQTGVEFIDPSAYFASNETDPVFLASPAASVINSGSGNLFLSDDGTYKVVSSDGNGIFDGSGSLSVNTTVLTAGKNLIFSNGSINVFEVKDNGEVNSELGYWLSSDKFIHTSNENSNVFVGVSSGANNTPSGVDGTNNVALGFSALRDIVSGSSNTAIGHQAMVNTAIGIDLNVVIGSSAGTNITGNSNTIIGGRSGQSLTGFNISVGELSSSGMTGSGNICIGYAAGWVGYGQVSSVENSIALGRATITTKNNQLVIGASSPSINEVVIGGGASHITYNLPTVHKTTERSNTATDSDNNCHYIIEAGAGTGTGTGASFKVRTAPSGASGTTVNSYVDAFEIDENKTAGETRMLLYDIDSGTVKRVSVGANDSGGAGYKVLRVLN